MPQQITECCECSPAWHLLEFVMTLETEAEGAAESSCGDECVPAPPAGPGEWIRNHFAACSRFAALNWKLHQLFLSISAYFTRLLI